MDPLSITASAVALIQAAGTVATTLRSVVRSLRTVDSRLTVLCKELSDLTGFLEAIDATLRGCQKFDLGLVDDALWRQSELALANCQTTLNELALLVCKIKNSNQPKRFARKVRAAVDLNIYGDDLVMYRDRIHQSNSALQTMLHAINVSLSVKNNASQDLILRELDRLEASINEALHTSSRPVGGFYNSDNGSSDARFGRNLRRLAEAAKHFHNAASSTAGTVRSDSSEAPWQSYPGAEMSLFGDFSVSRRERVEEFLRRQSVRSPEPVARQPPPSTPMSNMYRAATTASNNAPEMPVRTSNIDEEEEDDDAELERAFLDGLRELAKASFKDRNYDKAIRFLQEAMTRDIEPGEASHEYRQMQIELALCYLCQGKWRLAAPLVIKLAGPKARHDLAVYNLLHALALGYLSEYSFDDALATCKQALLGKKRLCKSGDVEWNEYWETLGLYATIFDVTGDCIRAEVFRLKLPADFAYVHPASEVIFIRFRTGLLQSIFGDDGVVLRTGYAHAGIAELDGGTSEDRDDQRQGLSRRLTANYDANCFTLRQKLSQDEKYQIDTAKEVVAVDSQPPNDADDEFSPASTPQESPLRRRLSRFFLAKRRRPADSEDTLVNSSKSESPLSDSSHSALSPTRLRWFKGDMGFQMKKPKNLLTKKPYRFRTIPTVQLEKRDVLSLHTHPR
ncbi:hypothetical protein HRG_002257 [Hirsutella rhossiliensis]|uniref:Azaphilone pigments biosynthesis cluster protein L N-terminal domain-containing protein n=1 Tax=Hirsutella rhossiliensis TaxID=111463 RepID=A0A9P8N245_9HYPO|nr:uncharacterized protein HRG_02257 [Hirsutella rhossiliensis]KAH0966848.1 hypothetical protein HRG_02257 [Hirsutella rhossiliensis]